VGIARQKGSLSLSLSFSLFIGAAYPDSDSLLSDTSTTERTRLLSTEREIHSQCISLLFLAKEVSRRVSSSLIQNVFLEGRRVPIGPKLKKPRRLRRPQTNGSLCLSSRSSSCSSRGWHRVKKGEKAHRASSITDTKTYPRLAYGSRGGGRGFRPLVYFGSRLGQRTRVDNVSSRSPNGDGIDGREIEIGFKSIPELDFRSISSFSSFAQRAVAQGNVARPRVARRASPTCSVMSLRRSRGGVSLSLSLSLSRARGTKRSRRSSINRGTRGMSMSRRASNRRRDLGTSPRCHLYAVKKTYSKLILTVCWQHPRGSY